MLQGPKELLAHNFCKSLPISFVFTRHTFRQSAKGMPKLFLIQLPKPPNFLNHLNVLQNPILALFCKYLEMGEDPHTPIGTLF